MSGPQVFKKQTKTNVAETQLPPCTVLSWLALKSFRGVVEEIHRRQDSDMIGHGLTALASI